MSATPSSGTSRDLPARRVWSTLALDIRFASRNLRRTPGLTAVIIATLALGIGATTAMFSVADAALFRPLPFLEAERLVVIPRLAGRIAGTTLRRTSFIDIESTRALTGAFESVAAYATGELDLTGGQEPTRIRVAEVTPNLFPMLGMFPRLGRAFAKDEERPEAPNVAILSHGTWLRQFGGDDHIVGKRIQLNAREYEIIGVMPPRFTFPSASDLWIPYTVPLIRERTEVFKMRFETIGIAKLAPGVTVAHADAQLASAINAQGVRSKRPAGVRASFLRPLRTFYSGDVRPRITIISGLVALVVLMACINVSGLLLARSVARRRELAVRKAIGASTLRLVRQLLTESLLLALAGASIGVGVAALTMRLFQTLAPAELTTLTPPRLDIRVLAAALATAVVTAVAFGVLPALVATRNSPAEALKSGGGAGVSRASRRISAGIVAGEVALAIVLLVGSGLMLRSLSRLFAVDVGFRTDQLVTARVSLPPLRYPTAESKRQFYGAVSSALSRTPGIQAAAAVNFLPLGAEGTPVFGTEGRSRDSTFAIDAENIWASAQYFSALGIKVIAGREFTAGDASTHVAVINESLAKRWPSGQVLGGLVLSTGDTIPRTIVGIVNDITSTSLDGRRENQLYVPLEEGPYPQATIVVRGSIATSALFARIQTVVHQIDPQQAVSNLKTMSEVASGSVAARRTSGQLAIAFGVFALVLAGIGIFGLLAFTVSERMPELGLRVALGAQPNDVIRLVLGDALRVSLIGAAIGGAAAFESAKVLRSLLFEVSPTDPLVFVAAPLVILVVAIIAAFQPGRRAIAADPLTTMRAE